MFETNFTCTGCGLRVRSFRMWNYRTIPPSMDDRDLCDRCKRGAEMSKPKPHIYSLGVCKWCGQSPTTNELLNQLNHCAQAPEVGEFTPLTIEQRVADLERRRPSPELRAIEQRAKALEERVDLMFARHLGDLRNRIEALESQTSAPTYQRLLDRIVDVERRLNAVREAMRGDEEWPPYGG